MEKWILWWILLVVVVKGEDDLQSSDTDGRYRRSEDCNHTATFTIENAIRIIEKLEAMDAPWTKIFFKNDFDRITNAVRARGYGTFVFNRLCGKEGDDISGLPKEDDDQLSKMLKHRFSGLTEEGVVQTKGGTIALGHVFTGICAGIRRTNTWSLTGDAVSWLSDGDVALDNLHSATMAGDLGQTCYFDECRIEQEAGTWDDDTCPMEYNATIRNTEATYAEMLGDIHGFILGLLVNQIKPSKVSTFLKAFYIDKDGLGDGKFHVSRSAELYKEAVSIKRLTAETIGFQYPYAKFQQSKDILNLRRFRGSVKSDNEIEGVVQSLFDLDYMKSCKNFPDMHKMSYFINLVNTVEKQSTYDLSEMAGNWNSKRKDGFEWYIFSEIMLEREIDGSTKIYEHVFEDNLGITLSINQVLLQLHDTIDEGTLSFRYERIMSHVTKNKPSQSVRIGKPGTWESGCPQQHWIDNTRSIWHADFISFIDSIVLANAVGKYIKDNPSVKLSNLLSEYYGEGLNKQEDVKSSKRFEIFDKVFKDLGSSVKGSIECYAALKEGLESACGVLTEVNNFLLKREDCDSAAQKACNAITQAVAKELKGNVQCKYGNIMKLKPQGQYSNKVRSVKASHEAMKAHMTRANKYKHCFVKAGEATGVQPALIAALASRESLVYSSAVVDEKTGISKTPGNKGYGMMQCDPSSRLDCTKYGPDSCEHVQQMIEELLVKDYMRVKKKLPEWTEEQHLQGAVAAYNFGSDDVQTWGGLDVGSTGNDFSGDVIARAQYLICTEGWKYCNEVCPQAKGSIPAQSTLQKHYPSPEQLPDSQLQDGISKKRRDTTSSASAADALRVCHMLNSIPGHSIDHRATGSKVAENGMVYYDESRKIRLYLDDRYSFAKQFSSVSEINGTAGVLFVQYPGTNNGIIGLWNGKKVLYIDDFTTVGNTFFLWSTATDCKLLAETGDCEFYMKCAEARLQCGEEGYPEAYGYKFCNKFSEFYELFTDKGKQWVDKVRPCLMTKLFPVLGHPALTCKKLTEVAFMSHVKCYVQKDKKDPNDVSFCDVMVTPKNWHALYSVYTSDLSAFHGPHWKLAWGQILQTLNWCRGKTEQDQFIDDAIENGIKKVHDIFSSTTWDEEDNAECSAYANAGNCKFYECFESRFRCKRVHGFSYLLQFELPSCLEFKRKGENFNAAGRSWLTKYQKCLMGKLLPLYLSEEVNCIGMGYLLKQHRATCMLEAGFCGVINDNQWFIELATKEYGYPLIEPRRSFTLPIAGTPDSTDNFYYRELDLLQRDIAYARKSCLPGPDPDVCVKRYSPVTKLNMKMKNPDYF